jgi:catechol 2,3-dioxygenase-like lactoylglutathione lyase family enzyme
MLTILMVAILEFREDIRPVASFLPITHVKRRPRIDAVAAMHLSSLAILVNEYEDGIAFFVEKLGFELLQDDDLGNGKRWVRVAPAGATTAFLLVKAVGATQQRAIGNQGGGRVWLFLSTDDFVGDHARMLANGVQFEESPRDEAHGRVAVFQDPFGNRWDLVQYKESK